MSVTIDTESGEARTTRTIGRSGNSTVIRLPPELLDAAQIERGQDVELTTDLETGELTIRPVDESDAVQSEK